MTPLEQHMAEMPKRVTARPGDLLRCQRCYYTWTPRPWRSTYATEARGPRRCPRCGSERWREPRSKEGL